MTGAVPPLDHLGALRRRLATVLALRAVLTGIAAGVLLMIAVAATGWLAPGALDSIARGAPVVIATIAGAMVAAFVRIRAGALSDARVALWVEERVPELDFALVTAADPRYRDIAAALAPRLTVVPWGALARRAAARALTAPAAAAILSSLVLLFVLRPPAALAPAARELLERGRDSRADGAGAVLIVRAATVRPPEYSGLPARSLSEPSIVAALAGSTVELSGTALPARAAPVAPTAPAAPAAPAVPVAPAVPATPDGPSTTPSTPATPSAPVAVLEVRALAGSPRTRALSVRIGGRDWRTTLAIPGEPAVVRVTAGGVERLVLLDPYADSVPVVSFAPTVRDTVLREPRGTIQLVASARDDIGLVASGFEWIVSSGEGESYTFRSGVVGAATHGGARAAELRAPLSLDALRLEPGDVVHVRAVARDGNTLSGPGIGASETRTVRVARAGEYDSLAVEAAPPAALDTTALSQRMLLVLTERLEERRPAMARAALLAEARRISADQTRLRRQVGELAYSRLGESAGGEHSHFPGDGHEHGAEGRLDAEQLLARASAATDIRNEALDFHGDETPVVAVNRPLLEAYNHMWDATRALDVGEPARAIPPMRRALEALQRARQAERIYLRGRPPAVVVDVARARLAGKERGTDGERRPHAALDSAAAAVMRRLDRAMLLRARDPAAASDSLQLIRADVLRAAPSLAATLGDAVELIRDGRDATEALARARRLAAGAQAASGGLPRWGGFP